MIKELNDSKELNNEEMAKLSGGYTLPSKNTIRELDKSSTKLLSWSWNLSSINTSKLMGF
jgi:hypothetical protein